MCYGPSLLAPINQCEHTGFEIQTHDDANAFSAFGATSYMDEEHKVLRIISPCGMCAITLESLGRWWQIKGVYTDPQHRRGGKARQLLAVARYVLGRIEHSDCLTGDGESFALACP